MPASRGPSFTTTVRMVHRVHRNTTNRRTYTSPTRGAGFAQFPQVVLAVAYFANRGTAIDVNFPRLA
jgi:hypothetical protein